MTDGLQLDTDPEMPELPQKVGSPPVYTPLMQLGSLPSGKTALFGTHGQVAARDGVMKEKLKRTETNTESKRVMKILFLFVAG